ncbi:unnamed protein product, partial [Leptidea sinapis]
MNTRKTTIRQLEDQLHQALKELKSSRAECEQLLHEREDSKREMLSVLGKNQKMKSELVELHSEMLIIQSHRDELQTVLAGFDQSSDAFDVALKHIADLEWELRDAHKQITILDSQKNNRNMSHTQSLFEELICNSPTIYTKEIHKDQIIERMIPIQASCRDDINVSVNKSCTLYP